MRFPLFPLKIGLAVALPAAAALLLGLLAVARLDSLADRTAFLEAGRLPRADLAMAVERRLLLAAQAIRGYALSADREALAKAKEDLARAAEALHEARLAADRPGMEGLAAEAGRIETLLEIYKRAAEDSVAANERVAADRAALGTAQDGLDAALASLAELRLALWDKELAARYPQPEALRQHARRIRLAHTAQAAGRDVRQAAETARAERDPARLAEALARYDEAEGAVRDSRSGGEEDSKRAAAAFAALADCRRAAATLLADWEALRETGRRILEAERVALAAARSLGGVSLAEVAGDAGALAGALRGVGVWLGVAAWAVLILGLGFAVVMAVLLGMPARRCAAFARDLAEGRLTASLDVTGRDEVGQLAGTLREMARRMGRRLAR